MRLAVISTPRSGNTWVRRLLGRVYRLQELPVHTPGELPAPLPERMVLQLHWHRTPELRELLRENGIRVVSLARHPLDVLVSILHFVGQDPTPARWLEGEGGVDELAGASPTSDAFTRFALGSGARALLSVTPEWWEDPDAVKVRYERFVEATKASVLEVARALGERPLKRVPEAIERHSLATFQALPNRHGWQGRPGLWRELLPADLARRIHATHLECFLALGYECDPDPSLTPARAEANWAALSHPPQREASSTRAS
jgi:hypothetical protein